MKGVTLATVLQHSGRLHPERAVAVLVQIATALEAAQAQHVMQRDVIYPANIVLTGDDGAHLVDVGVTGANDTASGTSIEALAYLAPERLTYNISASPATDVYALTCVLYACLTGGPPYPSAHDLAALVRAHQSAQIPRPTRSAPIPAGLDEVVVRGMAKDPAARYRNVAELVTSAQQALHTAHVEPCTSEQIPPPLISPDWAAASAAPATRVLPAKLPIAPRNKKRSRRWWLLAATATVVIAALAAGLIVHRVIFRSPPVTAHTPRTVTATITIDEGPRDVVVDPTTGTAFTTSTRYEASTGYYFSTLSVIDTTTNAITNTVNIGDNRGPYNFLKGLAVDAATHTVYVAGLLHEQVTVRVTRPGGPVWS